MNREEILMMIVAVAICVAAFIGIYFVGKIACEEKSISFEASRYQLISGCMVKHNGKWLPLDNIRGFD